MSATKRTYILEKKKFEQHLVRFFNILLVCLKQEKLTLLNILRLKKTERFQVNIHTQLYICICAQTNIHIFILVLKFYVLFYCHFRKEKQK